MNRKLIMLVASGLMAGSVFTGCNSSANKVQDAAENVSEAQKKLDEAELKFEEEWEKFKAESDEKIIANESEIKSYRELETKDANFSKKYKTRIDELERRNAELRARMNDYRANPAKDRWEEFKREFSHDMEELGTAFKDLTRDNSN